jgi:hypothetical protein
MSRFFRTAMPLIAAAALTARCSQSNLESGIERDPEIMKSTSIPQAAAEFPVIEGLCIERRIGSEATSAIIDTIINPTVAVDSSSLYFGAAVSGLDDAKRAKVEPFYLIDTNDGSKENLHFKRFALGAYSTGSERKVLVEGQGTGRYILGQRVPMLNRRLAGIVFSDGRNYEVSCEALVRLVYDDTVAEDVSPLSNAEAIEYVLGATKTGTYTTVTPS